MKHHKSTSTSRFDRLAGWRRNRRFRNVFATIAGIFLFLGVVLCLDPVVQGQPFPLGRILIFGILFAIAAAGTTYYHLRFLTRE